VIRQPVLQKVICTSKRSQSCCAKHRRSSRCPHPSPIQPRRAADSCLPRILRLFPVARNLRSTAPVAFLPTPLPLQATAPARRCPSSPRTAAAPVERVLPTPHLPRSCPFSLWRCWSGPAPPPDVVAHALPFLPTPLLSPHNQAHIRIGGIVGTDLLLALLRRCSHNINCCS
jgi:hypothetical protein